MKLLETSKRYYPVMQLFGRLMIAWGEGRNDPRSIVANDTFSSLGYTTEDGQRGHCYRLNLWRICICWFTTPSRLAK